MKLLDRRRALVAAASLCLATSAPAEVFVLKDGDRVTGQITTETRVALVVRTAYGTLTIPKGRVLRIVKDDGSDRPFIVSSEEPTPAPQQTPAARPKLVLTIGGKTVFYAWDEKNAPDDPTLRMVLTLDEEPLATYLDVAVEPDEIKGAILNSFVFNPAGGFSGEGGAQAAPPDVQPGRIALRVEPKSAQAGDRTLRIAYQMNEASKSAPAWRDIVSTTVRVSLKAEAPTIVRVVQDPGRSSFSGRKMKNVDTLRLNASVE